MGRIRVLDPHIANKIAAGEVVERPASVVKELVENSLDAHARRVEVTCENGGRRLIRVVDDGWGIGRDDLERAFLPHATSKLTDVEDLESIATLGFRGEALASIGAVGQASILSREREARSGWRIENEGGRRRGPEPAAAAPGTEVTVRNLFFNTPARAKFLRTPRTELGHIEDGIKRFALAHPEVAFRLAHEGTELIDCGPSEDRRERIARLYGRELADGLLEVAARTEGLRLTGFVGPPSMTRPHGRDLRFFVNGRSIQDRILHRLVRDAYRDALHGGRYPVVFLFLDVDPRAIDVNVHPTKAEIRWHDARILHGLVGPAISRALRGSDFAAGGFALAEAPGARAGTAHAEAVREAMADFFERARAPVPAAAHASSGRGPGARGAALAPGGIAGAQAGRAETTAVDGGPRGGSAFSVFQLHDSYLVCEIADGIAIVDQHALHERVNYDRILGCLVAGGVEAQRLLVPEQVELDEGGSALLDEHRDLLRTAGFEWSPFGGGAIALEAIPAVIPRERAADLLHDLVDLLRNRAEALDAKLLFHDVADTMACKASIRFGDRISREEARALLEESGALERAFVCPHGRPIVLKLGFAELERRFGRR